MPETGGYRFFRTPFTASCRLEVLAITLVAVLAACGDAPRPFRSDAASNARHDALVNPNSLNSDSEAPEFVIARPVGPRPEVAEKLALTLAMALRHHGILATATPTIGIKRIDGTIATRDAGSEVQIDITWTMRDTQGAEIGRDEQRILGKAQDWFDAEDRLISPIATQAAVRIGRQLGRGDLAKAPAAAVPRSWGPGTPPPSSSGEESSAAGMPMPGAENSVRPSAVPASARLAPPMVAVPSAPRIHVQAVAGAPGNGNVAMTSAMRRALGESEMVLADNAGPDVFQVQGSFESSPPVEGRQRVVIRWVVRRGDGSQIGDLEQANDVDAGSLDGGWDKLALLVATAAVDAVVDLITRDRIRTGRSSSD